MKKNFIYLFIIMFCLDFTFGSDIKYTRKFGTSIINDKMNSAPGKELPQSFTYAFFNYANDFLKLYEKFGNNPNNWTSDNGYTIYSSETYISIRDEKIAGSYYDNDWGLTVEGYIPRYLNDSKYYVDMGYSLKDTNKRILSVSISEQQSLGENLYAIGFFQFDDNNDLVLYRIVYFPNPSDKNSRLIYN